MNHTVSIITPCYNSGKYIAETIASVLAQTYTDWEWWIVDDCSKDDSVKIINEYHDPRIHLVELKQNSGAAEARNLGLKNARGRFITFIDSDDVWLPHFLETAINFLIKNQEELVYASYKRNDEDMNPLLEDFIAEDNVDFSRILYNCPIPMLTSMYDSGRIGKVQIPEVDMREDYAMWLEVLKKIPLARAIKEPLAIYRIRKSSYSRNKFRILRKQFAVYFKFLNLSLPKSTYYTLCWALNGMKKYEKFKLRNNR
ncbi:MAG TPA: glycosyltransferase [Moheibacter sp.]|nr:glycosyltransferase [Moheibacter sp.]